MKELFKMIHIVIPQILLHAFECVTFVFQGIHRLLSHFAYILFKIDFIKVNKIACVSHFCIFLTGLPFVRIFYFRQLINICFIFIISKILKNMCFIFSLVLLKKISFKI